MSVVCAKHAFMPYWPGGSSSICSEGSELQCIFILEQWFAALLIFSNTCDKEKEKDNTAFFTMDLYRGHNSN